MNTLLGMAIFLALLCVACRLFADFREKTPKHLRPREQRLARETALSLLIDQEAHLEWYLNEVRLAPNLHHLRHARAVILHRAFRTSLAKERATAPNGPLSADMRRTAERAWEAGNHVLIPLRASRSRLSQIA